MSDWVIFPWNVMPVITGFLFVILALYIARIPKKSKASKTLLMWLAMGAVNALITSFNNIAANSGWEIPEFIDGILKGTEVFLNPLMLILFLLFCYELGGNTRVREKKIVIAITSGFGLLAGTKVLLSPGQNVLLIGSVMLIFSILNAWVLIRKWRSGVVEEGFNRTSYLAFGIFVVLQVLLFPIVMTMVKLGLDAPAEFIKEVSSAGLPIIVGLLFLQFAPEPTSLEAKFIAVAFLAVIVLTQLQIAPVNTRGELRPAYAEVLPNITIELVPRTDGGYQIEGREFNMSEAAGDSLTMEEGTEIGMPVPFDIQFYGRSYDSLYVSANGYINFLPRPDTNYVRFYMQDVPSVAALNMNLDPSEGGSVLYLASEDSVVVTWSEIPLQTRSSDPIREDFRAVNAQLVVRSDGVIRISRGDALTRPVYWRMGISPGKSILESEEKLPSVITQLQGARGNLVADHFPISVAQDEFAFREENNFTTLTAFGTGLAKNALFNVFLVSLFLLVLVPLYFRLGIRRRLSALMQGLDQVNKGDLDTDLPVTLRDEVGQMSESFNSMTHSLRDYSGRMEELVEERTSELKATQAQLIEQEKLASLGSLTAGIAHEIKNPLNFVNNFAEVGGELADELAEAIAAGKTEEAAGILAEMKANAEQITKHGRRADDIVRSMMQHARGGISESEEIAVNVFLEEYANLAWHGMRARDHGFQAELERDFSENVGVVTAMPQELGRVILNLLNNAFDAVRKTEGAAVTVGTRATKDAVEIFVSDNGPGIPEDIREKIFEPFFTTKATGEGTGLGLSLSYDIITKVHGGTMTAGASEKGGAKFVITLPVQS